MIAYKPAPRPLSGFQRVDDPDRTAAHRIKRQCLGKRRNCREVARRRVARYARKHRIPKPIWPLLVAIILLGLVFELRPRPVSWTGGKPATDRAALRSALIADPNDGQDIHLLPISIDTGDATNPQPQYRPPSDFLLKDIAQVIAFLIRNRGRLDNDAVRAKWDIVDCISLPLAIFLREVEARGSWDDLEQEISAAPLGAPGSSRRDLPKSPRHRKVLRLLPEWTRRGEELLSPPVADQTIRPPAPDRGSNDDPDMEPPKP